MPVKDNLIQALVKFDEKSEMGSLYGSEAQELGLILNPLVDLKYIKEKNTMYIITEKGVSMLQRWYALDATRNLDKSVKNMDESSGKLNQQMLDHTKFMTKLTKWIFGFTIANAIFIIIQILITKGVI